MGKAALYRSSMLTLTIAHGERDPKDAYDEMRLAWNALATWWRKLYPKMKFFRTVELHADGFPHFHVLLLNAPFILQEQIAAQWAGLLGQEKAVVYIKKLRNGEHGVRYVCKYLLKQSEHAEKREEAQKAEWLAPSENTVTLEHGTPSDSGEPSKVGSRDISDAAWWGLRVRPWSASRGLLAPVEKAAAWWLTVTVKERVTPAEVAALAADRGMIVESWDDQIGFYDLRRDAAPAPPQVAGSRASITTDQAQAIEQARVERDKWRSRTSAPAPLGSGLKIPSGSWVAPWVR